MNPAELFVTVFVSAMAGWFSGYRGAFAAAAIPADGREHDCPGCGHRGGFTVWDCDGWRPPVVVDDEGRTRQWCPGCDVELEPAAAIENPEGTNA